MICVVGIPGPETTLGWPVGDVYTTPLSFERHLYCLTTCFSRAFVSSWCVYYVPAIRKKYAQTIKSSFF